MSIITRCDHCGSENNPTDYRVFDVKIFVSNICDVNIQLCEPCQELLKSTLKSFANVITED